MSQDQSGQIVATNLDCDYPHGQFRMGIKTKNFRFLRSHGMNAKVLPIIKRLPTGGCTEMISRTDEQYVRF